MGIEDGKVMFRPGRKPDKILEDDCPDCSLSHICEAKIKEGYGILTLSRGDHRTDAKLATQAACQREKKQ